MANSTCSITSIGDLLDKGDRNLLNITTTIAACPNICSLAWGKGNPDLSGIGLNVSYIMQAVLAVLCGPILALIYSFRDGLGLDEDIQDRLSEIHHSFINISAGFNIPVALAAVIRIRQYAPFFEQYFLLFLVGMQLCSFVNVVCAVPMFYKRHRRGVWTIPLYLGIQGLLLFITFMLMRNITKRVSIKELIESCQSYGRVLPFFVDFTKQVNLPDLTSKRGWNAFNKMSAPILYQIVQWVMIAIFAFPFLLGVLFSFKVARRSLLGEKMGRIWVIIAGLNLLCDNHNIWLPDSSRHDRDDTNHDVPDMVPANNEKSIESNYRRRLSGWSMGFWTNHCSISLDTALPPGH